jgi:hypothetical protein
VRSVVVCGLSLSITNKGSIVIDREYADKDQLKKQLAEVFPDWDGQDTFIDMVEWLNYELKQVDDNFTDKFNNETISVS